jgi:surface polysaccharide O-acyltransferase-like enzyme
MKQRTIGYDFIRIIAIFLVVVIHSNVAYLGQEQGSVGWYFVMLCTSACLVAVPLFFMVSGALLLDAEEVISIKTLFFKRILKQAIPFFAWSLLYVLARIVMGKVEFGITAFTDLFKEPAYYQFWFMYSLFAIYLLLPILQAVVLKLDRKYLEYLLVLWVVFSVAFPIMQKFIPGFAISEHVDLILCEGYIGYFLLGFYLKKYHSGCSHKKGLAIGVIGLVGTGCAAAAECLLTLQKGSYQGFFYQAYLTPFVAFAATGCFLFFQNFPLGEKGKTITCLQTGSKLSFGVYYVHMLVLTALEYVGLTGETNLLLLVVKILLCYVISFVAAFVIAKIPYVKKVLMC